MKERIKAIMDTENMSPARFADTLEIGRAVVSHILNGRNNPSLDVIIRILDKLPQINSNWLLTGDGAMYKIDTNNNQQENNSQAQVKLFPDLFSQAIRQENAVNTTTETNENEYQQENIVDQTQNAIQNVVKERIVYKEALAKKIRQIIIYYSDNTFETFNHE